MVLQSGPGLLILTGMLTCLQSAGRLSGAGWSPLASMRMTWFFPMSILILQNMSWGWFSWHGWSLKVSKTSYFRKQVMNAKPLKTETWNSWAILSTIFFWLRQTTGPESYWNGTIGFQSRRDEYRETRAACLPWWPLQYHVSSGIPSQDWSPSWYHASRGRVGKINWLIQILWKPVCCYINFSFFF